MGNRGFPNEQCVFSINGARLLNSLPPGLRYITNCSVDKFKGELDQFLSLIPDEPTCDTLKSRSLNQLTGKHSNSIIDHLNNHTLAFVSQS